MKTIIFNLEELYATESQIDFLLKHGYVYDPHTGDEFDPGEGVYYPEENFSLSQIEEILKLTNQK